MLGEREFPSKIKENQKKSWQKSGGTTYKLQKGSKSAILGRGVEAEMTPSLLSTYRSFFYLKAGEKHQHQRQDSQDARREVARQSHDVFFFFVFFFGFFFATTR